MAWSTAHDGNGTRLLFLIAAGESSPAGTVPGKQAAPWQLPGERGLGCPPLPCLPDAKLNGCAESPRRLGGPERSWLICFGRQHLEEGQGADGLHHRSRSIKPIQLL